MSGLGYERFGAQGGDIGAGVTASLGKFHPERVIGLHISSDLPGPTPSPAHDELSSAECDYLTRLENWEKTEGAYGHLQRTRPQTLAYGLNDSPAGLAAWIVEKYRAWSDCGGDIEQAFTKDELLGNISIYWYTQTAASSIRNYFERAHDPSAPAIRPGEKIPVPAGIAMFPGERDLIVPREYAARSYDIRHWTDMPRGGHFAALEDPELLVQDVRAFFKKLR
jgi:pimeloyl-ACP methyl ester carboxylesterase